MDSAVMAGQGSRQRKPKKLDHARLVLYIIKHKFPQSPEGRLFFAIVEKAILDLTDKSATLRKDAERYLRGDIIHAQLCGVDPEWIRRVCLKHGVLSGIR